MKKMTYNKCKNCGYSTERYKLGGGMVLICKIRGEELIIDDCPIKR